MNKQQPNTTTTSDVNLRTEPTTDSEIILVIPKNEEVLVDSLGDEWSRIVTQDTVGYLSTDYIKVNNSLIVKINEITYKESLIAGAAIPFFLILGGFYLIGYLKAQVTDRRTKSGKRTDQATLRPIIWKGVYYGFLAALIGILPLSLMFWFFDIEAIHSLVHNFLDIKH